MISRDSGASAIEYGALLLVAAVAVTGLVETVGERPARACQAALCRMFGGDCGRPRTVSGSAGGASPRPLMAPRAPRAGAARDAVPGVPLTAKAPIPPRVCAPNPGAKWVDGLNAHNDYQNRRPLKSALSNGATSVEVDLAFDPSGRLMVTHEAIGDPEGREFRATYVKPLIDRAKKNGGQIYPGQNGKFQLFVEVKSKNGVKQRKEAYEKIVKAVKDLPDSVEVVLPVSLIVGLPGQNPVENPPPHITFSQGFTACTSTAERGCENGERCKVPDQLDPVTPKDPHLTAYAEHVTVLNGSFSDCVSSNGSLTEDEKRKYQELVDRAHAAGLKVRLYEGPDGSKRGLSSGKFFQCAIVACNNDQRHDWWNLQIAAGADYLVTNHLGTGADWLTHCGSPKKK